MSGSSGISSVDRKSTRLNSSHTIISYAVFCLKKKRRFRRDQRMAEGLQEKQFLRAPGAGFRSDPYQILVTFFFLRIRPPPRSTLFPHPPLFQSARARRAARRATPAAGASRTAAPAAGVA